MITKTNDQDWLSALSQATDNLEFIRCLYWPDNRDLNVRYSVVKNHLLVFVEKGCINAVIEDKSLRLGTGTVLWLPPGIKRSFTYNPKFKTLANYRLHFELKQEASQLIYTNRQQRLNNAWSLQPFFQMLNQASQNPYQYDINYIKGLILSLSSRFNSLKRQNVNPNRCLNQAQQLKLNTYIMDHIHERIQPAKLASLVHFSSDYFSRIFRNTYGESVRTYLIKKRIHVAVNQLQETDLSIKEIAYFLGYSDENLFCRQFRQIMKCSPGQYRQMILA